MIHSTSTLGTTGFKLDGLAVPAEAHNAVISQAADGTFLLWTCGCPRAVPTPPGNCTREKVVCAGGKYVDLIAVGLGVISRSHSAAGESPPLAVDVIADTTCTQCHGRACRQFRGFVRRAHLCALPPASDADRAVPCSSYSLSHTFPPLPLLWDQTL